MRVSYHVFRSDDPNHPSEIANTPGSPAVDVGLAPATRHSYLVAAFDGGTGQWLRDSHGLPVSSNVASATTEDKAPIVTAVSPPAGPVGGGTVVTISGAQLREGSTVTFGGVGGTVLQVSPDGSSLTVVSPPQTPQRQGPVQVTVTNGIGPSTAKFPKDNQFAYAAGVWSPAAKLSSCSDASSAISTIRGALPDAASPVGCGSRAGGTATALADGRILVVGGAMDGGDSVSTTPQKGVQLPSGGTVSGKAPYPAAVYDPATGNWTAVTGILNTWQHTTTLLDGPACRVELSLTPPGYCHRVLVAGGEPLADDATFAATGRPSAEVYDPASNVALPTGSMATSRYAHTATLLDGPECHKQLPLTPRHCGKVLVVGGFNVEPGFYRP
ncbi:MAG: IPT/TIG domain-containing protein, partial [Actinobacteria bacterium]|nr:IPT/TIG domain-containing protein [Actinomycetota bacterium]